MQPPPPNHTASPFTSHPTTTSSHHYNVVIEANIAAATKRHNINANGKLTTTSHHQLQPPPHLRPSPPPRPCYLWDTCVLEWRANDSSRSPTRDSVAHVYSRKGLAALSPGPKDTTSVTYSVECQHFLLSPSSRCSLAISLARLAPPLVGKFFVNLLSLISTLSANTSLAAPLLWTTTSWVLSIGPCVVWQSLHVVGEVIRNPAVASKVHFPSPSCFGLAQKTRTMDLAVSQDGAKSSVIRGLDSYVRG